ncbi:MAG: HAMP domain-containing histidine kinase [Actinobacteria bacterium]|nr:HAMP domain-containing histidine kinase [Actinomycetota bacterium]
MSFRTRIALLAAAAVAVAVVLASAVTYVEVHHQLYHQVDNTLRQERVVGPRSLFRNDPIPGDARVFQSLASDGSVLALPGQGDSGLSVTQADRDVAAGVRDYVLRSTYIGNTHYRVITRQVQQPNGYNVAAVQEARPLTEADNTLHELRLVLLLIAGGGIAIAAGLGLLIARTALRPVKRLTGAAEHVAETQDLSASIPVESSDELGRLAQSFNEMLAALAASRDQQQQLVADASHELRTPLTSLRTNIEVLARVPNIDPGERERLLADVTAQLEEMGVLVNDLVELAREERVQTGQEMTDIRLDELVKAAVERARRHAATLTFITATEPCLVHGNQYMLERALANLLDNASKWSPPAGTVEVVQTRSGEVMVRDHGPGIPPESRSRVFDRFYRAPSARSMPGSGLGLAIVRRVTDAHHGSVTAEDAPGGGTLMRIRLPVVDIDEPEPVELQPESLPRV